MAFWIPGNEGGVAAVAADEWQTGWEVFDEGFVVCLEEPTVMWF